MKGIPKREEAAVLGRQIKPEKRGGKAATAAGVTGRVATGAVTGLSRLIPTGGIQHPDNIVQNRELYIGGGGGPSLVPGMKVSFDKSLLVGRPPRRRGAGPPPRKKGRKGSYNKQMNRMRRLLL